jgi:hypothetical protein
VPAFSPAERLTLQKIVECAKEKVAYTSELNANLFPELLPVLFGFCGYICVNVFAAVVDVLHPAKESDG